MDRTEERMEEKKKIVDTKNHQFMSVYEKTEI